MRSVLRSTVRSYRPAGAEASKLAAMVATTLALAFCLAGCNRQKAQAPHPLTNPAALNAVVWAVQRTGTYYCRESAMFGRDEGLHMKQAKALDSGYQPQYGAYCTEPKTRDAALASR